MNLLKNLNENVKRLRDEYENVVSENGQTAIKASLRELFEEFPELTGVRWSQCTPYFNDGDECIFGVNEVEYNTSDDLEEGWDPVYTRKKDKLKEKLTEFSREISSLGQAMKVIFDDHVIVSMMRGADDFEIVNYDHD